MARLRGVTLVGLIVGAVNTYVSNGNANGGAIADPANSGTLEQLYDQTSDASPSVNGCMQIVANIQNTLGEWEVENTVEEQHQLVQYGSCKFGVQGTAINGNVNFLVGAQNFIDIIHSSISQFASNAWSVPKALWTATVT